MILNFFYEMLRIRRIEEAIARRYAEQTMRCPVHLSIGQEAIAVGVCQALKKEDYILSNHRAHAHYLAKGGNLKTMISEIFGKSSGCSSGRGGSMHLVDLDAGFLGSTSIVGGSLPVAVGVAFGTSLKKENRITAVFFGEGSTEEGVWSESLNFAALKKLPVLFICENNLYSVYSPLSVRQPLKRNRVAIAAAHGIDVDEGNGNNPEEVFSKTQKAIAHIKGGNGPYFLEFSTYRFREHCGPNVDNHLGYRPKEEVGFWENKCPIKILIQEMKQKKLLTDEKISVMETKIAAEIEEAFSHAKNSSFPSCTSSLRAL
jgi:pyruvate dehydrogenase E1 component alpha subunit